MKALIFDASSLITLALSDLLYILEPLKEKFCGDFFITEDVKKEIINKPIQEKRFMLEAMFFKRLLENGVFRLYNKEHLLLKEKERILQAANTAFISNGELIRLIHFGEASCLALFNLLSADKKAVVIDERTTRMLCEAPDNLRKLFEGKLHTKIEVRRENYQKFKDFKIIRSCELALIAYNHGIIELPARRQDVVEAIMYATKFKGCAVSSREIAAARKIF
jgi:hypothetical protein